MSIATLEFNFGSDSGKISKGGSINMTGGFGGYEIVPVGTTVDFEQRFHDVWSGTAYSGSYYSIQDAASYNQSLVNDVNALTAQYMIEDELIPTLASLPLDNFASIKQEFGGYVSNGTAATKYGLKMTTTGSGRTMVSGFEMGSLTSNVTNESYFNVFSNNFMIYGPMGTAEEGLTHTDGAGTDKPVFSVRTVPAGEADAGNTYINFDGKTVFENTVDSNGVTIIDGGFIRTDLLNVNSIQTQSLTVGDRVALTYFPSKQEMLDSPYQPAYVNGDRYLDEEVTPSTVYVYTDGNWISESPQGIISGMVFKRSATQPAAPIGGTYSDPNSVTNGAGDAHPEIAWSDGIPVDDNSGNPVWTATRWFTSDGTSPQDAVWNTPVKMVDTANIEYVYNSSLTQPPLPPENSTGTGVNPSTGVDDGWVDNGDSTSVWMAVSKSKVNGNWTAWGLAKIKGEDGVAVAGDRGAGFYIVSGSAVVNNGTYPAADAATPGANVEGDVVSFTEGGTAAVRWNGSSWDAQAQLINGNLLVTGTIRGEDLIANGTISGQNIIGSSGVFNNSAASYGSVALVADSRNISDGAGLWVYGNSNNTHIANFKSGNTADVFTINGAQIISHIYHRFYGGIDVTGQVHADTLVGYLDSSYLTGTISTTRMPSGVMYTNTAVALAQLPDVSSKVIGSVACGGINSSGTVKSGNGSVTNGALQSDGNIITYGPNALSGIKVNGQVFGEYGTFAGNVTSNGTVLTFTGGHYTVTDRVGHTIGDIMRVYNTHALRVSQTYSYVELTTIAKDKTVLGVLADDSESLYDMAITSSDFGELSSEYFEPYIDSAGNQVESETAMRVLKADSEDLILGLINSGHKLLIVNALGEGMMNMCSIGGDIENGDYICSSIVPGKGMKQDDDLLHNYTVAKSLEDVVWADKVDGENGCYMTTGSDGIAYKTLMVACTYHAG